MQLRTPLSVAAALAVAALNAQAENYVTLQYMSYNESDDRTSVSAPAAEINLDIGTDFTVNAHYMLDSVSGASPTYYDASSGASAFSRGSTAQSDVTYGNVDYEEGRTAWGGSLAYRFPNRDELTIGYNDTSEKDFYGDEASIEYLHHLDPSKNRSVSLGVSQQSNEILVECVESDVCDGSSGASKRMTNTVLGVEGGYTQVIDASSYAKGSLFYIHEDGYLGSPYHNVVRDYDTAPRITHETRPDTRTAYGASLRYYRALNDVLTLHTGYRFYHDDWNIDSHTLSATLFYEIGDFTIEGGLRYYMQSEADFYSGEKDYFTDETYASSDERLSDFDALNYKLNVDYHITSAWSVNAGAEFYDQSTGLSATTLIAGVKYRF
jgi:hypothetical protein